MAKVSELVIKDVGPDFGDPEVREAFAAAFPGRDPGPSLVPLVQQEMEFRLDGSNPATAVALHRVMTQEVPGPYLHFDVEDVDTASDDPFMLPEFLQLRVQNIPLRHGAQKQDFEGFEFRIEAGNDSPEVLTVYSGDLQVFKDGKPFKLSAPLFNPTHEIAFIQPGKSLRVGKIRVVESTGRVFEGAAPAVRGRHCPLDLKELPREATHRGFQGDAQRSGFVKGPFESYPAAFRVGVTIPAAARGSAAARTLPIRACNNILMRLRLVSRVVERAVRDEDGEDREEIEGPDAAGESSYWEVKSEEALAVGLLHLQGETTTITQLLKIDLIQNVPDASFVGSSQRSDTNAIQLQFLHRCSAEDLSTLLLQSVSRQVEVFERLRGQFEKL